MIELESIKQIKSPSLENVIIFALRCANYMIINDKLNGLIAVSYTHLTLPTTPYV